MAICHWHRFIVLTKRGEQMLVDVSEMGKSIERLEPHARELGYSLKYEGIGLVSWPLPNVILGVSVEDQKTADERIPLLLQTPAAIRMVSYEPALGPVDFEQYLREVWSPPSLDLETGKETPAQKHSSRIDWLIVGGESGPGARPCNVEWIRSTVNQCNAECVKCFVKQLGSSPVETMGCGDCDPCIAGAKCPYAATDILMPLRDRKGGDPSEWPADLRVRETP
jgi:hypothetical protein